jgi:hypothetical protein
VSGPGEISFNFPGLKVCLGFPSFNFGSSPTTFTQTAFHALGST